MARESWGIVDRLPSGRYRARYTHDGARHKAPETFETKTQAREYLAGERSTIAASTWIHPDERDRDRPRSPSVCTSPAGSPRGRMDVATPLRPRPEIDRDWAPCLLV